MAKDDVQEFNENCREQGGEPERMEDVNLQACVFEDENVAVLETGDKVDLDSLKG